MSKRQQLSQKAYRHIRELLVRGVFDNAESLTEQIIYSTMKNKYKWNASSMPIKQALVKLEYQGFIAIAPRRGITITKAGNAELTQLLSHRYIIEEFICSELARQPDIDITQARIINYEMETICKSSAFNKSKMQRHFLRKDILFHSTLAILAGYANLARELITIRYRLLQVGRPNTHSQKRMRDIVDEHFNLLDAIRLIPGERGERGAVVDQLRLHLRNSAKNWQINKAMKDQIKENMPDLFPGKVDCTIEDAKLLRPVRLAIESLAISEIMDSELNECKLLLKIHDSMVSIVNKIETSGKPEILGSDLSKFLNLDLYFHNSIVAISNYRFLEGAIREIWVRSYPVAKQAIKNVTHMNEVLREHKEIITAIQSGDKKRALRAIETHLDHAERRWTLS